MTQPVGRPRLLPPKKRSGKQPHVSQPVYMTAGQLSRFGVASQGDEHVTEAQILARIVCQVRPHHRRPDGQLVYDAARVHDLFNRKKESDGE